jgi:transposase
MLRRIKFYVDNNPDKIVLGTGDKDQLEPVEYNTYTAIGIDENRLLSGSESTYQTVIIDNQPKEVLEILETRFKNDLNEYFRNNKY